MCQFLRSLTATLAVLVVTCVAGCGPTGSGAKRAATPVLSVAAASDLMTAMPEAIARFREESGIEVRPTFGASGKLAEQIKAGTPFDLYLAANESFVNDLADGRYVDRGSVRPYATGSLVLAVYPGTAAKVEGLADLTRPDVQKVAIANPDLAPYGAAARAALRRAGLWDQLSPKLAIADTVRQALQFVETGNAEVGLVGRALATGRAVRVVEIDPALYDPLVQSLGVVAGSKRATEAEAFARFLTGREGQAVLASYGFKPPKAPAAP